MLHVRKLRTPLIHIDDLTVGDGDCLAVVGPSGAGKSLLLRAIADLDPNDGEVYAAGMARHEVPAPRWRRSVAYVPAESGWWADRVGDHVKPVPSGSLLSALRLPADCLDWPIARLSTGERQRLALARALVRDPPVLLLDEPTAALDEETTEAVETLIQSRLDDGVSVLVVTHTSAQAQRLAARTIRIEQGRRVGNTAP